MILLFGGTTEGRKAAEVLEEAGTPFYYSTKTGEQQLSLHHGQSIDGALDAEGMKTFCQQHDIRLLIDAAHPFATQLHHTVYDTGQELHIPIIRYERIYPPRSSQLIWIDDYSDVPHDIHTLLATTGVQSISKLKPLEQQGMKIYYRILNRPSSIALAHQQGAADQQLCYYEDGNTIDIDADAILLKESGLSGGFQQKVDAALKRGMRVIVIKRPDIPVSHEVNGPHGLRRMVEQLLPDFFPRHSGLTTGTCATAAAVAAARRLLKGEMPDVVPVILPDGETLKIPVGYGEDYAYCIKDAGDDPDVTNGIEIRASVQNITENLSSCDIVQNTTENLSSCDIMIEGGEGVGRFTLPGFDYPPGEPAINKGPRQMIRQNLSLLISHPSSHNSSRSPLTTLSVTLSVPQGAEIAQKTFNPRLGIEGGISIIGVSGIVKPFSEEAFISSIRKCMEVARASFANLTASNDHRVVINSGAKSERFVREYYPHLPQQAFVQYGNYIGETLRIAHDLHIPQVTLGVMLGKAVKLAAGHLDTHSRRATMDISFIQQLLAEAQCQLDINEQQLTLARELWHLIPEQHLNDFAQTVIHHCYTHCRPLLPDGQLTILLIDEDGHIYESKREPTW